MKKWYWRIWIVLFVIFLGSFFAFGRKGESSDIGNYEKPFNKYLSNDEISRSGKLNKETLIALCAQFDEISEEEATAILFPKGLPSGDKEIYSLYRYESIENTTEQKNNQQDWGTILFYVEEEEGSSRVIKDIKHVSYAHGSELFAGTLQYYLSSDGKVLHFTINGHVYEPSKYTLKAGNASKRDEAGEMIVEIQKTKDFLYPVFGHVKYTID
ncbi:hypothetical protein BG262_01370 [Floricoccus penangensis]|uniref:Uncharacterized protein n=1 Tax=Floricoccus penangensis TaxID=1859475 RepID=A0A9Q5NZX2_9LACT|nr:hypothetical protein [Floricoccus penangensis]OFI47010.1 hypothetical protein BG262_01370 [Floricoccus penangensis]